MKKTREAILCIGLGCSLFAITAISQNNRSTLIQRKAPELKLITTPEGETYYEPTESKVRMPSNLQTGITVTTNFEFSTKGLNKNVRWRTPVPVAAPYYGDHSRYLQGSEDAFIEFFGNDASSIKGRSGYYWIELKTVFVTFYERVSIGTRGGLPIQLPPGTYRLDVDAQLFNMQLEGRFNVTFAVDMEDSSSKKQKVKAPFFGPTPSFYFCDQGISMVAPFAPNFGIFGVCQLGRWFFGFFNRQNAKLPSGTRLTFFIKEIRATRISNGITSKNTFRQN